MKSRKLSKSTKIFLLTSGLVISAAAATASAFLLIDNKKVEIRYLFENLKFDNKEQIFDYAYAKLFPFIKI